MSRRESARTGNAVHWSGSETEGLFSLLRFRGEEIRCNIKGLFTMTPQYSVAVKSQEEIFPKLGATYSEY